MILFKERLVLVFLMFFIFLSAQKKSILDLKLSKGESFKRSIQQYYLVEITEGAQVKFNSGGIVDYKVLAAENGNYIFNLKYDSLYVSTVIPGGKPMLLNSSTTNNSNETFQRFSEVLGSLKGKDFQAKFSKSGEVLEVIGFNNLLDSIFIDLGYTQNKETEKLKQTINRFFGNNFIKDNHNFLVFGYKQKRFKTKAWEQKSIIGVDDSLTVHTQYQFKKKDEKYYYLEGKSKVEFKNNTKIQTNSVGLMKSRFTIDKKSGWVVDSEFNQVFTSQAPDSLKPHNHSNHSKEESNENGDEEEKPLLASRLFWLKMSDVGYK